MKGVDNSFVVVQRRIEFFNIFLFMPSATYFLSAAEDANERLKKSKQKMPPSNAGRLAQRKLLKWLNIMRWPAQLECHKNIRCETVSRAVRDGFG